MKRIHDSLDDLFRRHRIIFWYDEAKEWGAAFDSFVGEGVEKLRIAGNEFGIKVRILSESGKDARFLVYSAAARPADTENWLLDLVLQGHEFKADRASLAVQELGISYDFRGLAEQHVGFFRKSEQARKLKALIVAEDEIEDIRVKMMAVLAGTAVEIDSMLLKFLDKAAVEPLLDPVADSLGPADLAQPFWRDVGRLFGYTSAEPCMRDFVATLFRGADPLDDQMPLHAHAQVFLQRRDFREVHHSPDLHGVPAGGAGRRPPAVDCRPPTIVLVRDASPRLRGSGARHRTPGAASGRGAWDRVGRVGNQPLHQELVAHRHGLPTLLPPPAEVRAGQRDGAGGRVGGRQLPQ